MFLLSWGRYGFDRHYEAHFATHLADVKRQLNITAKNNNSYALAAEKPAGVTRFGLLVSDDRSYYEQATAKSGLGILQENYRLA